ncbi:GNAT family N-acetyltransferase [Bacillus sp. CECT 9360]|uniref:GNAT family N-acetyltransferase n=1 Tax=Bacillus sp. CECT 9360 TaxID=2845821 RepID=UPI001E2F8307|nr:GNAT family N-acetyltransferase [Bacillus sp. CECT 9360]CAH0346460.1 dTDP-fucosamine acetyltransferase [Bacillus sp. CECT 9360]
MNGSNIEHSLTFYDLKWDTDFFGVKSAKAILHKPLTKNEWDELKARFNEYQFISIENRNSEPINAQFIGKDTTAFLADVNVQFSKKLESTEKEIPNNITLNQKLKRDEQIIDIAKFEYSKFTEDLELAKRGGTELYQQWLSNSFERPDKHYVLYKDEKGNIIGFLLYSFSNQGCVIELIAVSESANNKGIGTSLVRALESEAYKKKCTEFRVGTQIRNLGAINFYHKVGCKLVGCHQVFHLWNL